MKTSLLIFTLLFSTTSFALPTCSDSVPIGSGCRFNCPGKISCGCGTKTGHNTNTLRLCPEDGGVIEKIATSHGLLDDSGRRIVKKTKTEINASGK